MTKILGKSEFLVSATYPHNYPDESRPEIAIVGRSNPGKSSLLNAILNQDLAKVSGKPGKTALLNFFNIGKHYRLVDLPGYGYAQRSKTESAEWQNIIETFLMERPNLIGLILVMDIRRDWDKEESQLKSWLGTRGLPMMVVLTKTDKLTKSEILNKQKKMQTKVGATPVYCVSSLKRTGLSELEDAYFQSWVKKVL
jgi:GTP-binding protein